MQGEATARRPSSYFLFFFYQKEEALIVATAVFSKAAKCPEGPCVCV